MIVLTDIGVYVDTGPYPIVIVSNRNNEGGVPTLDECSHRTFAMISTDTLSRPQRVVDASGPAIVSDNGKPNRLTTSLWGRRYCASNPANKEQKARNQQAYSNPEKQLC